MRGSPPQQPTPIKYASSSKWEINEALIAELQRCGATNVDKGFQQLLHTLLGISQAQHLRCHLVDSSHPFNSIILTTLTAGLESVATSVHHKPVLVSFSYDIRPGRQLRFEFTPMPPYRLIHLDAAQFLLSTQHRWLVWLDLSHGPVSDQGGLNSIQRSVLLSLLQGMSEKQMAAELNLNINTAHLYVKQLYRRFGVRNRASLMSLWLNPAQTHPTSD